jgi:HEXXH motif-containing protein
MEEIFELPEHSETKLALRGACQVALLRERLVAAGAVEPRAGEILPTDWLATLSLADLMQRATPFFWLNVVRLHAACKPGGARLAIALRDLLMTSFDAFFPVVPDGFSCRLPAADDRAIVLPRLGVHLPDSVGPAQLCRVGRKVLRVEHGGQAVTLPLESLPADTRLAWLPVGRGESARLLLSSAPALFPDSSIGEITTEPPDPAGHAAMITSALEMIHEVDPRRGEQIAAGITWYVPLHSPNPENHRSWTAPLLRGVIFLSPSQDRRTLAEAIVHEYYHGVLNARMELEPLLAGGAEPRFYSPWRNDPRPLSGLLHALYVFAGVAEFLLRAEGVRTLAEQRGALRERRRLVVERLRLGSAQVPLELVTAPGRRLLAGLQGIIDRHEAELGLPSGRLPDVLAAHLRAWSAAHPRLAAQMRQPVLSGA